MDIGVLHSHHIQFDISNFRIKDMHLLDFSFFLIYAVVSNGYHIDKQADYLKTPHFTISKMAKDGFYYGIQVNGPFLLVGALVYYFKFSFPAEIGPRIVLDSILFILGVIFHNMIGRVLDIALKRFYRF